jgi:signal transduction histidine kinase
MLSPYAQQTLVDTLPIGACVFTGLNHTISAANDLMLTIWSKDNSVIGKDLYNAIPEIHNQGFFELLTKVYQSGQSFRNPDGKAVLLIDGQMQTVYFDLSFKPLRDKNGTIYGIVNTAVDTTERVMAARHLEQTVEELATTNEELAATNEELSALNEEYLALAEEMEASNEEMKSAYEQLSESHQSLEHSEEQIRLAKDAAGMGMFDLNIAEDHLIWDERCKELFGLDPLAEVSYSIDFVKGLHPDDRERILKAVADAYDYQVSGGNYHVEYRTVAANDGQVRHVRATGQVHFDLLNQPQRFVGVVIDITGDQELQKRKDDFISVASHELKTPITSLKASLQLMDKLKDKPNHPMLPKLIMQSRRSAERVGSLIEDLLNVGRLKQQQVSLKKNQFILSQLLNTCANPISIAGKHRVRIVGDLELEVYADEDRIDQVVTNFLSNAVKYAPDSDIIDVAINWLEGFVKVSVTDYGQGIPENKLTHLFERYYRVDETAQHVSGLGLGLYICKEIIDRHEGKIGVESEMGKGTTFWFSIPQAKGQSGTKVLHWINNNTSTEQSVD